ncbi:MAG: ACP S-malonyltransferase [Candidatus Sericytochromatia bacterium]
MKKAFLFPGQGSQGSGMGLDIFENFPEAQELFDRFDSVFGQKISSYCFSYENHFLQRTEIAQPCILAVSLAILSVLDKKGIKADYLAGHSLGEYTALVHGGVLTFESALNLVKIRSTLMAKAGEKYSGTMAAVIGMSKHDLERACNEFSEDDEVVIANYNAPEQLVVSGTVSGVEKFSHLLREKGKKVIPLNVSGAFHSHLMTPALRELTDAIEDTEFFDAQIPIVTNIDNTITFEGKKFKEKLKWQLISPVLWEDSIKSILSRNINVFIEVGAKKTLTNLNKRIDSNIISLNVEDTPSLDKLEEFLDKPYILF